MASVLIKLINLYKNYISPFLPPACRFMPTCSIYSMEAIKRYGPMRGSWLSFLRILKCHPFHPGGYDPLV